METSITSLAQARKFLHQLGLFPRKGLGQHFLVNRSILTSIVAAAELTPEDTVVEVGPGLGLLTRALAQRAGRVVAVELDPHLAQTLARNLPLPNLEVVQGDILHLEPTVLVKGSAYKVVANIPYYITSPILRHFLEARWKPHLMVVMVQREVAEAIVALPGKMSLLAVSVQFYSQPRIIGYVSPRSFYPAPKVESAILKLEIQPQPPVEVEVSSFFRLVAAGFAAPRKQLRNSLAQGLQLPPQEVVGYLEKTGIEPRRRAESLNLQEWGQLWKAFSKEGKEENAKKAGNPH